MENLARKSLCMGCMREAQQESVCPDCGFDATAPHHPLYLKAGSQISKRFVAGRLITYNGEGASYLGYDYAMNQKVLIREYMPDLLAVREKGGNDVLPIKGKETQYKALLSDFADMVKALQRLRTYSGLLPVLDFFEKNNTAYAIYAYPGKTTLRAYIKKNGPMTVQTLSQRLAPILSAVEAMHSTGEWHRGISADTVFAGEDGSLYLGGFAIAAARTAKSELAAELFAGYSAPELYSLTGLQGAWTDVYALAAVCYTALTGVYPPDALRRETADTLQPARKANFMLGSAISDALTAAMALDPLERTQTVGEFCSVLTQSLKTKKEKEKEDVAIMGEKRGDEMYRQPQTEQKQQRVVKRKIRTRNFLYMLGSTIITSAVLLTGLFLILKDIDQNLLVFAGDNASRSNTVTPVQSGGQTTDEAYYLPNFVGSYLDTIKNNPDFMVKYALTIEEEDYNDEYPTGVVYEQNPPENTKVDGMSNVAIKVSKGPAPIPENIVGMGRAEAEALLTELKVKYTIAEVYDNNIPTGCVVGYTRMPGELMLRVSLGRMDGGIYNDPIIPEGWTIEQYEDFIYGRD